MAVTDEESEAFRRTLMTEEEFKDLLARGIRVGMGPHDILTAPWGRPGRIVKGDGPYPHASSCAGCQAANQCHGCGQQLERQTRCVSVACPACCCKLHRHPRG